MTIKLRKRGTATLMAAGMAAGMLLSGAMSGTADAQSGSRICGNYWKGYYNGGQKEVTWSKVIEVVKTDGIACQRAVDRTDNVGTVPNELKIPGIRWGSRQPLKNVECEWYSQQLLNAKYGDDVCHSMTRADNVVEASNRTISQFWIK